ncbi:hypothetical protein [Maribacter algarum]|uniref:hypothetical protein n=1 Tax=Maribacter algarum (ex Zhang et al. 2020) TaxID=2578118 RepID=UPI00110A7985|nr:hypothetical protein [Maribacter algarum]
MITILTNMRLNRNLLLLLTVLIIMLFSYFWKRRKKLTGQKISSSVLFFEILKLGIVIAIFSIVSFGLKNQFGTTFSLVETEKVDETITLITDSTATGISKYYLSQQTWKDFNRKKHSLPFKVNYMDVLKAHKNRNSFAITSEFSWGIFYKHLVDHDTPLIEALSLSFYNYQKESNMSRRDFAELIISSIQDIPYNLILSDECKETDIKPCFGNIKLGVYAPAEFVSSLRADCDTRTVLIYTILSRFNYDVAILNSEKYLHSVIGLNIPSTGKYKTHNTKKYYFVETTARGCPIGYLPNDVSNISYWKFALIHNKHL